MAGKATMGAKLRVASAAGTGALSSIAKARWAGSPGLRTLLAISAILSASPAAHCAFEVVELQGPPGSVAFGSRVTVLANGNFLVVDRQAVAGDLRGAVHLYTPNGVLISTLRGSSFPGSSIGDSVVPLPDGRALVASLDWASERGFVGALTIMDGRTGIEGTISAANSLVGSTNGDRVGVGGSLLLDDGTLVFTVPGWDRGAIRDAGALVVLRPGGVLAGEISAANAIVGSSTGDGDEMRFPVSLGDGYFAFSFPNWDATPATNVGAVRIVAPGETAVGELSFQNALIGLNLNDRIGYRLYALANGNAVVASPEWDSIFHVDAGAVTWLDRDDPLVGPVSIGNSQYGSLTRQQLGLGGVVPLRNGNYVLRDPDWPPRAPVGFPPPLGAVAWRDGSRAVAGPFAVSGALVGVEPGDRIGSAGVFPLDNGNYVVASPFFKRDGVANSGAATWADGAAGLAGTVSKVNSLYGAGTGGDLVGVGVVALQNGAYFVQSSAWGGNGGPGALGAVTWGNGRSPLVGAVSASNSLIGPHPDASFGDVAVRLDDDSVVVGSARIQVGTAVAAGLLRRIPGNVPSTGVVPVAGSVVGSAPNTWLSAVEPLPGGDWLVRDSSWGAQSQNSTGAIRWCSAGALCDGPITEANALVGDRPGDNFGAEASLRLPGGDFAFVNRNYFVAQGTPPGALTFIRARERPTGPASSTNTVAVPWNEIGEIDFDPSREQAIIGVVVGNRLQIVRFSPGLLFRDGLECIEQAASTRRRLRRCPLHD